MALANNNDQTPAMATERLDAEISLLKAMYPDSVTFDPPSREVHYTSTASPGAIITFRLPERYPERGHPDVISARDGLKNDVRDRVRRAVEAEKLLDEEEEDGVEILDQMVTVFEVVVAVTAGQSEGLAGGAGGEATSAPGAAPSKSVGPRSKTVIIWLHHLLATSKRKLAVTPAVSASTGAGASASASVGPSTSYSNKKGSRAGANVEILSGITKPGYPGIMIFSGPKDLVDAHVRRLKAENWQAFQVRWDSEHDKIQKGQGRAEGGGECEFEFEFTHGKGKIVEVETMAEVVRGIVREEDREVFLRAVGVK